jgi:hypothetical protein
MPDMPHHSGIGKRGRSRNHTVGLGLGLVTGAALFSGTGVHAVAADAAIDKAGYTLFKPTPREFMRELSTDRPDKTESPYTVDAGHFQFESDLVSYSHDHDRANGADTVVDAWGFGTVNAKVGLLNWMDLQLGLEPCNRVTTDDRLAGQKIRQSGLGDLTTRLKMNLWGNDGGPTALAVMPFVKAPTNQDGLGNSSVEGGVILPLSISLPAEWEMCVMTEFDFLRNASGTGAHTDFINTITFGHDIVGRLGGYVEFFSAVSTERDAPWIGTVDLGLTYGLTENLQLDAGINLGVTRSAEDFNPFVGVSWRF